MISDDHEVEPFNVDFTKKYRGDGKIGTNSNICRDDFLNIRVLQLENHCSSTVGWQYGLGRWIGPNL